MALYTVYRQETQWEGVMTCDEGPCLEYCGQDFINTNVMIPPNVPPSM